MYFNYIIILLSIIIIIFIIFYIKQEYLTNSKQNFINNDEHFETIPNSKENEYFFMELYGAQTDKIYNNTSTPRNLLQYNDFGWWVQNTTPEPIIIKNSNITIKDTGDACIYGLEPNKTYKLDISLVLYNYNINDEGLWQFYACPLISTKSNPLNIPNKPLSNDNYDYKNSISSLAYLAKDYIQYTFNINSYINNWSAFTIFLINKKSVDVVMTFRGNDKINTNINISLFEI